MKILSNVLSLFLFSIACHYSFAQVEEADQTLIFQPFAGGLVETKSLPPATVTGSLFLDDNWQTGNILLKNGGVLKQVPLKYNLESNELLVETSSGVKSVYSDKIKQFSWISAIDGQPRHFVNVDNFTSDSELGAGFFEILIEGPYTLASKASLKYYKPNYNAMYDAGNQDGRFSKTEHLYYIVNGKTVHPVPKKKKLFFSIFGDKKGQVESYMKEYKYNNKDKFDLVRIFNYYNSLLSE